MGLLSRTQIDGAGDLAAVEVPVPEWGGAVLVRMLSGDERANVEDLLARTKKTDSSASFLRVKIVGMGLVDAQGARLFADADLPQLGRRSAVVLERLCDLILEGSGLKEKSVEEEEKNSASAPA